MRIQYKNGLFISAGLQVFMTKRIWKKWVIPLPPICVYIRGGLDPVMMTLFLSEQLLMTMYAV